MCDVFLGYILGTEPLIIPLTRKPWTLFGTNASSSTCASTLSAPGTLYCPSRCGTRMCWRRTTSRARRSWRSLACPASMSTAPPTRCALSSCRWCNYTTAVSIWVGSRLYPRLPLRSLGTLKIIIEDVYESRVCLGIHLVIFTSSWTRAAMFVLDDVTDGRNLQNILVFTHYFWSDDLDMRLPLTEWSRCMRLGLGFECCLYVCLLLNPL